jgi:hypothetical protein
VGMPRSGERIGEQVARQDGPYGNLPEQGHSRNLNGCDQDDLRLFYESRGEFVGLQSGNLTSGGQITAWMTPGKAPRRLRKARSGRGRLDMPAAQQRPARLTASGSPKANRAGDITGPVGSCCQS